MLALIANRADLRLEGLELTASSRYETGLGAIEWIAVLAPRDHRIAASETQVRRLQSNNRLSPDSQRSMKLPGNAEDSEAL